MADDASADVLFVVAEEEVERPAKVPAGRAKVFRHYHPDQCFVLPPSINDWLPAEHTARFIAKVVEELVDLSAV
ncbi:MAG: hypothetical protein M0Z63_03195 [Actinomycetota bacterium]|nr:hypothetical protein [Actinomycetota bacterium]